MKFYQSINKRYLYLYSEDSKYEKTADDIYNFSFNWKIPSQNIIESELRLISITSSVASTSIGKYIIRANLNPNNIYNNLGGDPILYTLTGLNAPKITNSPTFRLQNMTLQNIKISINTGMTIATLNQGLDVNVDFIICLEIIDYLQEDSTFSYNVNENQN